MSTAKPFLRNRRKSRFTEGSRIVYHLFAKSCGEKPPLSQLVNFKEISVHPSAEESPGFLLWQISTRWRRAIEATLKPLGLTHPQFVVLATTGWLTRTGEKASQAEIGRQAAIDPNTTSQILRGLQAKRLIKRPHTTDERSKHPTLTALGAKRLAKALPAVERADAAFFASAPLKGSEILKTLQLLAQACPSINEK